jgi:hypothetical protein
VAQSKGKVGRGLGNPPRSGASENYFFVLRGLRLGSYSLVRTASGGFSVSVYQDKSGTDESTRVARDWIAKNAGKTGVGAPTISQGTVVVQLK